MFQHTFNCCNLTIQQGSIVDVEADALVNAANSALAGGGGVDGAIHRAGGPDILQACRLIGGCPTGSAVATTAGKLKAQYIFHAVGPIYQQQHSDALLLKSTYEACLSLAEKYQCQSIAFPSISTGAYRYPISLAAPIALTTVIEHLKQPGNLQMITFVLFDKKSYDTYERVLKKMLDL